jgi:exonuclease III
MMRWLQALHDWLRQELAAYPQLALLGDFNIGPQQSHVISTFRHVSVCPARPC